MKKLLQINNHSFSISNDLLLSLSMAHAKECVSQQQLAEELHKNLQLNPKVISAFARLDRKYFQGKENLPPKLLYGNNAIKLTSHDNMTTPIMHLITASIFANAIGQIANERFCFLDVGTGRGYIPFLMKMIYPTANVEGTDINSSLVAECESVRSQLNDLIDGAVRFYPSNVLKHGLAKPYDFVNVGFAVSEAEAQLLLRQTRHLLLCPVVQGAEQWLMKFDKQGNGERVMKCVFQRGQAEEKIGRAGLKEREELISTQIRAWHSEFQIRWQRKPSLKEMQENSYLKDLLRQLKDISVELKKL